MHIGIIKYKTKIIYLDLKDQELHSYYYHDGQKYNLSIYTVYLLFKNLFDHTKEKLLEQNGKYSIYINEETGYKHYYQNNKEDISKFFMSNGQIGLIYKNTYFEQDGELIPNSFLLKLFLNRQTQTRFITLELALTIIFLGIGPAAQQFIEHQKARFEITKLTSASQENPQELYYDFTSLSNTILSTNKLPEDITKSIYNEELLTALCNTPMTEDRILSLQEKITGIEILPFPEKEKEENEQRKKQNLNQIAGFYNAISPNIIYIDSFATDTIIHEFIHLLQDNNEYYYIREASAEIIKSEFYSLNINAYKEETIRIKILMEIIGSDPIWQINFNGNDTDLNNILSNNLSQEDYQTILEILTTAPSDNTKEQREEINSTLDKILSNLYYNMYHSPIEENEIIQTIYKCLTPSDYISIKNYRHYFQDQENTAKRPDFLYTEYMTFQQAEAKGLGEGYAMKFVKEEISQEEFFEKQKNKENVDIEYKPLNDSKITRSYDNENYETIWITNDGQKYTTQEALDNNYIRIVYLHCYNQEVDYRTVSNAESYKFISKPSEYDYVKASDTKEIDGKRYYMVECSKKIYMNEDKIQLNDSSKSK